VPRTALEQCRSEYDIVKRERDEARETLRQIFENLQAWLTEHNLAAQKRAREPPPRPTCTCGEPYVGCSFHVEWCPVHAWLWAKKALGRVKANEIP
jgi:hypothetical protein